jgi:choline dehydrogenase-like flavoprotein
VIVDLAELADDRVVETDICVIGGGAAGIAIAWRFRDRPDREVVVLESGGVDFDPDQQDLFAGELTGQRYNELDVDRLRMLGGATNHWGNQVGPFEPIDFETRPWIPHSGWPISRADLDPWYREAAEYFGFGPYDFDDLDAWRRLDPTLTPLDLSGSPVVPKIWRVCEPAFFAGERHAGLFERHAHLTLFLHANVTRIGLAENGRSVRSVEATSLNGRRLTVNARRFVLATGAVENARLLLANDDVMPTGVGNQRDLVGRFFIDHVGFGSGYLTPRADVRLDAYDDITPATSARAGRALCFYIDPAAQRAEEISVVRFKLDVGVGAYSSGARALTRLRRQLGRGDFSDAHDLIAEVFLDAPGVAESLYGRAVGRKASRCMTLVEPFPNPDSRVTLTDARDALGMRRVNLNWMITDAERRTLRRAQEIFADAVAGAGVGRLKMDVGFLEADWSAVEPLDLVSEGSFIEPGHHHGGTTRMASGPDRGVVDADCKVFGVENLHVAGNSVFPTAGSINPTFTIVALALRLADHLGRVS